MDRSRTLRVVGTRGQQLRRQTVWSASDGRRRHQRAEDSANQPLFWQVEKTSRVTFTKGQPPQRHGADVATYQAGGRGMH